MSAHPFVQIKNENCQQLPHVQRLRSTVHQDHATSEIRQALAVTCIRNQGSLQPIFCVGENLHDLDILATYLEPESPVFALHLDNLALLQGKKLPLEVVAEALLQQMRTIQPRGPYNLAGSPASVPLVLSIADTLKGEEGTSPNLVLFHAVPPVRNQSQKSGILGQLVNILKLS